MDRELHLKLTIQLYTDDNRRCFGPGIATLLERVREHHSLRAAASSMEMAYSGASSVPPRRSLTARCWTPLPADGTAAARLSPRRRSVF